MPLRIPTVVEKTFFLRAADPALGTTVTFRQATNADVENIEALFPSPIQKNDGSVTYPQGALVTIAANKVFRSIVESNMEDENGKPVFWRGMNQSDFFKNWGKLPPAWADEIYAKCLHLNPQWGTPNADYLEPGEDDSAPPLADNSQS
jgi:hypothetical protein